MLSFFKIYAIHTYNNSFQSALLFAGKLTFMHLDAYLFIDNEKIGHFDTHYSALILFDYSTECSWRWALKCGTFYKQDKSIDKNWHRHT